MLKSGKSCVGLAQTFEWSIIPLQHQSKAPALTSWGGFQHQRPSDVQLNSWESYSAFGVICGSISKLLVLDFDQQSAYQQFCLTFPDLLNTLTVRSGGRGGYHLYYQVNFPVRSQRILGGDLLAEGKYVVAPGSIISDKSWDIVSITHVPCTLSKAQLQAILEIFGTQNDSLPPVVLSQASPQNYKTAYRNHVAKTQQRNHSLYVISRRMQAAGCDLNTAINLLADLHANEPPRQGQIQENFHTRRCEAIATIRSAYRHRIRQYQTQSGVSCVPNALRERLLQRKDGAALLRVFEGLLIKGVQPGDSLSLLRVTQLLDGVVGRHSVLNAYNAQTDTGEFLFPPHTPQHHVDSLVTIGKPKTAAKDQPPNVGLGLKNRILPSVADLCALFNIPNLPGDPITFHDLASANSYRAALLHQLIRRRPGIYSREWLAQRLGTTMVTLTLYTKQLKHHVLPHFQAQTITWKTLDYVPARSEYGDDFTTDGRFLEDESGKRYPPYQEIAAKLLKQGRKLTLKQQLPNYYWDGDDIPPFYGGEYPLPDDPQQRQRYLSEYLRCLEQQLPLPVPPGCTPLQPEKSKTPPRVFPLPDYAQAVTFPVQPALTPEITDIPARPPAKFRQPLPDRDDEIAADMLNMTVSEVRLTTARWIVQTCGKNAVYQLINQLQNPRILDRKAYLLRCVRNLLKGTGKPQPPRSPHRPLRDIRQETAAQKLHTAIPELHLSNARKLVELYGEAAVRQTLAHTQRLGDRIHHPAGFFINQIRVTWKRIYGDTVPVPRFEPVKPRKPRRKPYDPLKAFLKIARKGKIINWSYLNWRTRFFAEEGLTDPFAHLINQWRAGQGDNPKI